MLFNVEPKKELKTISLANDGAHVYIHHKFRLGHKLVFEDYIYSLLRKH